MVFKIIITGNASRVNTSIGIFFQLIFMCMVYIYFLPELGSDYLAGLHFFFSIITASTLNGLFSLNPSQKQNSLVHCGARQPVFIS